MRVEENDGDTTDSEDDEIQDYTSNRENIHILTRRRETSNAKDKEKHKKEGSENKKDNETSDTAPKIDKLSRLRNVLKTVAEGYELGKKHSMTNKAKVEPPERACIIKETSEEENVTEDTSDEDYQSYEEDESLIESNSDQTGEGETQDNLSTTSDTDTSDREEGEETDYSNENTDGSVNERCLLISSAANIRRREMQGEGYFYKEG